MQSRYFDRQLSFWDETSSPDTDVNWQTLKDKGPLRKAVTTRGAASEVVKDFQSNYLFNHIGWIAVAFVTLCFSENELLVRYPEEVGLGSNRVLFTVSLFLNSFSMIARPYTIASNP